MYNLFGSVYLDHYYFYKKDSPKLILTDEIKLEETGISHSHSSLHDYMKNECEENFDFFWEKISQNINKPLFIIYVNFEDYCLLLIQYWKSLFSNFDLKTCQFLLKIHFQDQKLRLSYECVNIEVRNSFNLSDSKIKKIFNQIKPVNILNNVLVSKLNYEILLAQYLRNESNWDLFKDKFEAVLENFVLREVEALKGELKKSLYEHVYASSCFVDSSKHFFEEDVNLFSELVRSKIQLNWIFCPDLSSRGVEYLRELNGNISIADLYARSVESGMLLERNLHDIKNSVEVNQRAFEYILARRYRHLLFFDINRVQGTMFFDSSSRHEVNHLLVSFFYDLARSDDTAWLRRIFLRGCTE